MTAMGRVACALVGVGALLAAASCSGSGPAQRPAATSSSAARTQAPGAPAQALTAAQLKSALLRASDLPGGYSVASSGAVPSDSNAGCPSLSAVSAGPGSQQADVALQSSAATPSVTFLEEDLLSASVNEARAYFRDSVSALAKCGQLLFSGDKLTMKLKLSSEPYAHLGDSTAATRLTGSLSEGGLSIPVYGEMILIQDGFVDISIDNLRIALPDKAALTRQAATAAIGRIARLGD